MRFHRRTLIRLLTLPRLVQQMLVCTARGRAEKPERSGKSWEIFLKRWRLLWKVWITFIQLLRSWHRWICWGISNYCLSPVKHKRAPTHWHVTQLRKTNYPQLRSFNQTGKKKMHKWFQTSVFPCVFHCCWKLFNYWANNKDEKDSSHMDLHMHRLYCHSGVKQV